MAEIGITAATAERVLNGVLAIMEDLACADPAFDALDALFEVNGIGCDAQSVAILRDGVEVVTMDQTETTVIAFDPDVPGLYDDLEDEISGERSP